MLNLAAALGPQGPLTVPLGQAVDSARAELRETGLRLGGAFGPGPDLGRAIVLDGYGRPYWIDLDRRRMATKVAADLHSWLSPADDGLAFSAPLGLRGALSLHLREPLEQHPLGASPRYAGHQLELNFALSAALGEASRLTVAHGWSLQGQFGLASEERSAAPGLLTQSVFTSPYLALADGGDGVALAQGSARDGRCASAWDEQSGTGTNATLPVPIRCSLASWSGSWPTLGASGCSSDSWKSRGACSTPAAAARSAYPTDRRPPFSDSPVAPNSERASSCSAKRTWA